MNRTRKIVAAGIGTAVILAVVVIMLLTPPLHTQTPVSTGPPSNGGPGNGGNGGSGAGPGSGTGSGAGNNTASNCTASGDDHEWDDHDEGNVSETVYHPLDDGNWTNETDDHDWGECNATGVDHDSQGDQASDGHHGAGEDQGLGEMLTEDALAFAPILSTALSTVSTHLASLSGFLVELVSGSVTSIVALSR